MGNKEAWVGKEEGPPGFTSDIITGSLCIDVRQDKEESTNWLTEAWDGEPRASSDDEDEPSATQELNQREKQRIRTIRRGMERNLQLK